MGIDTVFSPSFGNRPSHLVGRQDVLHAICTGLETKPGSRERATVIIGQRGYGKTVLLWEIADRARKLGYAVANPVAVREGFVGRIDERLRDDALRYTHKPKAKLSGGNIGALGFSAGVSFEQPDSQLLSTEGRLERTVRELSKAGHGSLILVDELQANSPDVRSVVDTYQELVGEGLDVAIVLTGLPSSVSATLNDRVLTFLNRARRVKLDPLPFGDIEAYYNTAFKECGVVVPDSLCAKAAEATYGSPYLMQLIGHYTVLYAPGNGALDKGQLAKAIQTAEQEFERDICMTTLSGISGRDTDYLRAIARVGRGKPCKSAEVNREMDVSADYGQRYRRRLLDAGIIEAPRHGMVSFAVPYLADFLLNESEAD